MEFCLQKNVNYCKNHAQQFSQDIYRNLLRAYREKEAQLEPQDILKLLSTAGKAAI